MCVINGDLEAVKQAEVTSGEDMMVEGWIFFSRIASFSLKSMVVGLCEYWLEW